METKVERDYTRLAALHLVPPPTGRGSFSAFDLGKISYGTRSASDFIQEF
jgi:hypothetical protein